MLASTMIIMNWLKNAVERLLLPSSRVKKLAHKNMRDCFRAIVRQIGQYGICINHESMHLRWKLWLQFVSNLQFSPVLNLSKHTAHSEVSSVLSLSVSSTLYRKQGSFFKSSSDIFVLPPLLLLLRTTRPFSAVCLIKDLPSMQK